MIEMVHHKPIKSMSHYQYTPDNLKLRRKSCHCSECGTNLSKESQLPTAICEVAMHKKVRLADYLIKNTNPRARRTALMKQQFRLYAKNTKLKLNTKDFREDSETHSSPEIRPPIEVIREQKRVVYSPKNNSYLINLKQQMSRTNRTIEKLLIPKKSMIISQTQPLIKMNYNSPRLLTLTQMSLHNPKQRTERNLKLKEIVRSVLQSTKILPYIKK